jgi:hypothetical protein
MSKKLIKSPVNPLALRELFFAGRARLTFRNQDKGTHMTVHVKQAKDKADRTKKLPIYFVNVSLLGDGDQGYNYLGAIFSDSGKVKLAKNISWNDRMGQVMRFIVSALRDPEILRQKNVALFHEGKCCRCGLPLTNPQSIDRGLGDDCYGKVEKVEAPF